MKKNKLLILILLMTIAPFNKAHTKPIVKDKSCNEDFSFNINLHSNFIKGTANELVYTSYPDSYPNPIKDRLNSKIIWEIDDLYMTGLGFNFQKKWLAFHGDYWHKAADGNATMDDYDWANWANMESTDWTHWSHHNDTIVTKGSIYDFSTEFIMPSLLEEKLKVSFLIGYKKTNFKWEARGGTYIYPLSPGDFSKYSKRTFPDEPAISYEQTIKTPYVGIGLAGNLERFKVSSRLIFSKWAAFEAEDRHYTRDFRVYYKMKNGKMYSYNINALYDLTNHFSLGLGYDYTNYDTVRDDSTWDYGDLEFVFIDNGGANLKTSILSSTLTYSF